MVDVIDVVLDGGGLLSAHEHANSGDTHHATFRGHLRDRLVGLAAWVAWRQGAAVRVRDEHRTLADLKRIERGAVAAV